ncbi:MULTISPECIES: hypothetical protein [unclassified Enterococcus]|uniref:hypothetical protein n=1 Tax=unclassified Enterococcus TaxID=2608891 RepID=UPI001557A401|nr:MULTISPECIES: hypothetical protein [unclassified Enterococcus]MBS7576704.1 hypothetical protein [Enterococcus sp. MMGLQ5-2]MBS7583809.1 hypothetical protein [Enterococcus sp. MMGLQ5-1]NPD11670.1 hypothetical protein [Enterococcus sp. MMGLQ5-1]NPD36541.1 hypothetical protein [Enterococcus sp. MMGLQ5-2]
MFSTNKAKLTHSVHFFAKLVMFLGNIGLFTTRSAGSFWEDLLFYHFKTDKNWTEVFISPIDYSAYFKA